MCKSGKSRLAKKSSTGIKAYCTQKLQNQLPLNTTQVYRFEHFIGIYYLSARESHLCYDIKVLPIMALLESLSGGTYYEIGE